MQLSDVVRIAIIFSEDAINAMQKSWQGAST